MSELLLPFLLLILALILLVAEDLLPTGGVLGVLAAICLVFVLYLGFSISSATGFRYLLVEAVIVPSGFAVSSIVVARTGLGKMAYLRPPEAEEVDVSRDRTDLARLVGLQGRALTTLRPSGMVDFEGRRLDGVAEQGLIPSGALVQAIQVRSGRLIVRVIPEETPPGIA